MNARQLIFCGIFGAILLLWLFCLPRNLFYNVPYSTVVTAANGQLLGARVADDGQWRFPPCDSVPRKFAVALIEYEDRTFRSHFGVSIRGLVRACRQNLSNGRVVSGGSTITMQTIRLSRRGKRNIIEKIVEAFMATRMELTYSKDDILRLYASHAPFGGNVVGIEAAMWKYLGNDGSDMSWAEAATLAVLQNAPAMVNPSKNRHKLLEKRDRLLKRLFEKGELSRQEYELALDEPLVDRPCPMPSVATHLVEFVHERQHGERVKTSINYPLQLRLEKLAAQRRRELALQGANDLAAIVVDVETGRTVAYCGNADIHAEREGRWVDIGRAARSSGSVLKPLLYCAALQEGLILPNTLLPDVPTDFGGFYPKNYDGSFHGVIDASEALSLSLNVPNVWLLKQFGVSRFAALLRRCGLSTVSSTPGRYGLSLILGGAEVTLEEITLCYAGLARFDRQMPLTDSAAIFSMFDAMARVSRPDGIDAARVVSVGKVAWKTGTSYGARDGWAIGVTPQHVVGVWVGNADGSGVAGLTGASMAGPVMFDILNMLPASGWFDKPNVRQMRVCSLSGHVAGKDCVQTEWKEVSPNAVKSPLCPYCRSMPVSTDLRRRVYDASEPMQMKSYFMLDPVQKLYYKQNNPDFEEPPAAGEHLDNEIKLIYPQNLAAIFLPVGNDGRQSALVCKAAHANPAAQLFWHLDDYYVGSTTDLHQVSVNPAPGSHRLTVFDSLGHSISVTFEVAAPSR